jgi:hypothetical protein
MQGKEIEENEVRKCPINFGWGERKRAKGRRIGHSKSGSPTILKKFEILNFIFLNEAFFYIEMT